MSTHTASPGCIVAHVCLQDNAARPVVDAAISQNRFMLADVECDPVNGAMSTLPGNAVVASCESIDAPALVALAGLRKRTHLPIILLATGATVEQRILLLALGIDHVLDHSVDIRELAAILRNATRSARRQARKRAGEHDHQWRLDDERWMLVAPGDRDVRLTRAEHDVLRLVFDHPGTILSRCDLVAAMNGPVGRGGSRALDVLLSRLRHKVWECAGGELPLRSARGAGYLFAGTVSP